MGLSPATAETRQALMSAAAQAARQAHATRSGVHVGAAVLSTSGAVHSGCNVENAAFPLGNCAEPSAIAAGVLAEGRDFRIAEVAIWAGSGDGRPLAISPCGGCRQRLAEFAVDGAVLVHFPWSDGELRSLPLGELLPYPFRLEPADGSTPR